MTPPIPPQPNGWFEKYVVDRLDSGADRFERMEAKLDKLNETVPRIDERTRITAVIFGLIGGVLPAVAALIYLAVKGHP